MFRWESRAAAQDLGPEPLSEGRVDHASPREDLQGDVPAERFLNRLVHHPHTPVAEFAEDHELAEPLGRLADHVILRATQNFSTRP